MVISSTRAVAVSSQAVSPESSAASGTPSCAIAGAAKAQAATAAGSMNFNARMIVRSRSEEHTSELQSLMRISYAVFCLKKKIQLNQNKKNKDNVVDIITEGNEIIIHIRIS